MAAGEAQRILGLALRGFLATRRDQLPGTASIDATAPPPARFSDPGLHLCTLRADGNVNTRILFLDDSGKPDMKHASRAVVIAGFAVPSENVVALSRRVLGAKHRFYPRRGSPASWEIKAADVIKPNPWKRRANRDFAFELVRIIKDLDGTMYSVTIDKANVLHPMGLSQSMPLQLQALVEHFEVECRHHHETGMVVADWSSPQADHHASRCVASFVASKKLAIHPGVYYASSAATETIQVADLFAGVRRRVAEGDTDLAGLAQAMAATRTVSPSSTLHTIRGRRYDPTINLFRSPAGGATL